MRRIFPVFALAFLFVHPSWCHAQTRSITSQDSTTRRHYDAAYRLQAQGHIAEADAEHVAFLVEALTKVANGYANIGDYAHAQPIYDEGLILDPNDFELLKNYAAASLDAKEYKKVGELLSTILKENGKGLPPLEASPLWRMLGDTDLALKHQESYLHDYQTALSLDPSCENLFAEARAHLIVTGLKADPDAFSLFFSRCGDSSINHFKVGRAYALNNLPEEAAGEFQRAISKESTLPGLHYSLGAAYLDQSEHQFDKAETEFRKELALNPSDKYSYAQLGHIALIRHHFPEAEMDFRHAITADPLRILNYIQLGQILSDEDRRSEAEPVLRRAIELAADPSKDNYTIERAHFMLGRLLLKDGKDEEGQRELNTSKELLDRSRQNDIDSLSPENVPVLPLVQTRVSNAAERRANEKLALQMGPLIAGSYNNLGVHAAMDSDFIKAARNFELASKWNPQLAGVEMNLGRAAFFAHRCASAMSPLERALATHPGNAELQNMLATCREQVNKSIDP